VEEVCLLVVCDVKVLNIHKGIVVIFWKHCAIALSFSKNFFFIQVREIGLPLETNFGKGGIEALVKGTSKVHTISSNKGIIFGVGLVYDCVGSNIE